MSTTDSTARGGALGSPERRAALGILVWLLVLGLASLLVSAPFRLQVAGGAIDDGRAMFLQALLVSVVALTALLAADAFSLREVPGRLAALTLWGLTGAAALAGVAGILDAMVGGTSLVALELPALLALGLGLTCLAIGLLRRSARTRRTRDWAAAMAVLGSVGATFMAYVAAWILTFGDWPRPLVAGYAGLVGMTQSIWLGDLVTGYAHLMPAAVAAVAVAIAASALPADREGNRMVRGGLLWLTGGIVLVTLIYMVSGFSVAQPPLFFQSGPAGLNGLWAGNLAIGVGVLLAAVLTLAGLVRERPRDEGAGLGGAFVVAAVMFLVVAGLGSYVESHESLYGLGALAAPGASANAAFTWFVQDIGWLLLPALIAVLVALPRLVGGGMLERGAAWALAGGSVVAFAGGLVYVFAAPAPTGPAFAVTAVGLVGALVGVLLVLRANVARPAAAAGAGRPTL